MSLAAPVLASAPIESAKESSFSPYANNGGTTIALAGKDYAVVGADTRMSEGYSIATRNYSKLIKLTEKCVLATSGMQADMATLHKTLRYRLEMYEHQNGKPMSTPAIAQMLGNMLYYRRFFPYYCFNVLGGIDDEGVGCAYSYDAVGSFERVRYSSSGTGQTIVQPVMDNQIGRQHQLKASAAELSIEEAENLVKDVFNSAGERDIYTGDFVEFMTISKDGISLKKAELKLD